MTVDIGYNLFMKTIRESIAEIVLAACKACYPNAPISSTEIAESIEFPDKQFGDVSSSIALKLASLSSQQPREAAQLLADSIEVDDIVKQVAVAGPGYLNFSLAAGVFDQATKHSQRSLVSLGDLGAGKRVVMDYSHPNIGKPMGVHHLLSTIIGDSIKRTMRQSGYDVIADNFIGDLGTQFGKLIWAVKQWGDTDQIEDNPIDELQKLYVKFHIAADNDTALDDAGRAEYLKLEKGDPENRELWRKIVAWSKAEIQPIYDALDITFDYMNGESFYEDKMDPILKEGKARGVLTESDGALVCMADKPEDPPAILKKSDGATLYITRDLARIDYWEKTWRPDTMIVVVDAAQQFAQRQLYEVARKLELTDADLVQVNFGRMRFADGSMSTRKGNILLLKELLDEAAQRALVLVEAKAGHLSEVERQQAAQILAISSIKYNILSQNRVSDIVFDWDTILNFEGNSAPYLLYTLVRIRSLLNKAEENGYFGTTDNTMYDWQDAQERSVALLIDQYSQHVERTVMEYRPNILANYAYSLCQKYNNIYNNTPILQAPEAERSARLALTRAVEQVLSHALGCLGLEAPNKM